MEEVLLQNPETESIQIGDFDAHYLENADGSPGIILIEEIWGVNENIKDIAKRLYNEGYTVIAPELLAETGIFEKISPEIFREMQNPETKDAAQQKMREALAPLHSEEFGKKTVKRLKDCFQYLKSRNNSGKIGVVGFCFGGTYSYELAINESELSACVPFYGRNPSDIDSVRNIRCPVMAFYGGLDIPIMNGLPELLEKMKEYNVNFQHFVYEDARHAFFNDKNLMTYDVEAAQDAWEKMKEFLNENLK